MPETREYITSIDDSLMGIAIRELGDERKWRTVSDLNSHRFPGMQPSDQFPFGSRIDLPRAS